MTPWFIYFFFNQKSVSWKHILRLFFRWPLYWTIKRWQAPSAGHSPVIRVEIAQTKRSADTFTETSQGPPRRKLVWWQYPDGRLPSAPTGDQLSPWLLAFVCVCRESHESWLAFPAWLSLKEPMNCCIKWILQAVVFSIPTGETRVGS